MGKIHHSLEELVGKTPLLELDNYEKQNGLKAHIITKVEYFNPAGSTKDRIAQGMIRRAEHDPRFDPKKTTLVETTSGNTGIALAALCAAKGYKLRIYIQDVVSVERRKIIKAFGAELVLFSECAEAQQVLKETGGDFVAATAAIRNKVLSEPNSILMYQMINPENPASHYRTTGKEIWNDTKGDIDIFVSAVGTGGTISGAGKYLKRRKKNIHVVAVEPADGETGITGIHRFSDVPPNHFPGNLYTTIYDEVLTGTEKDAFETSRAVAKSDGLLVGPSSGAAIWAATQVAKRPENEGKNIVVILPDTGLRYLSTGLFD